MRHARLDADSAEKKSTTTYLITCSSDTSALLCWYCLGRPSHFVGTYAFIRLILRRRMFFRMVEIDMVSSDVSHLRVCDMGIQAHCVTFAGADKVSLSECVILDL